jgi:hypothetical protein
VLESESLSGELNIGASISRIHAARQVHLIRFFLADLHL